MKRNYKIIAGLIVVAGISSLAFAQPGRGGWGCDGTGPMGMEPMGGQGGPMGRQASMKFDPAVRAERRLEFFKTQLQLTPEQQPLWQAFADKAKEEAGKGMRAMRDQTANANLTAPERMAKMQTLMQERLNAMTEVNDSFNRLYTALSPEQKKVADLHAAQMGQGGMGGMGGKSGGRPGPGRMMPPAPPAPQS